jgi:hypothetical protein
VTKDSDDKRRAREIILKRRRQFVIASAAASISLASCDEPRVCLNIAIPEDPDAGTGVGGTAAPHPCLEIAPQVCLNVQQVEDAGVGDAGTDAGSDAAQGDKADAGKTTSPNPVTKPPTHPRVCLRYAAPPKDVK